MLASAVLSACQSEASNSGSNQAPTTPKPGGTLVVVTNTEPRSLDGNDSADLTSRRVVEQVIETLMRESPNGGSFQPWLAEKWSVSNDGLEYTFNIRNGVKFHDGSMLDAQAVKFSIERQTQPDLPANKLGTWAVAKAFQLPALIKSVEVAGPLELKVTLNRLDAAFLSYLASVPGFVPSPKAVEQAGASVAESPVGTGPFKFVKWDKGVRLTLERNPEYWGEKPLVDQVVFQAIPESQGRIAALKTGSAHLLIDVPADLIQTLDGDRDITLKKAESRSYQALNLNGRIHPALGDKRVRQAMSYAINKEAIVKDILQGQAVVADGLFSKAFDSWAAQDIRRYEFNLEKARTLLREAGYANGFGFTLSMQRSFGGAQNAETIATAIQSDLAKVNIRVTLEVLEAGAYSPKNRAGEFEATLPSASSFIGDPSNFMGQFESSKQPPAGFNWSFYSNAEYDRLVASGLQTRDESARLTAYHQAQKILAEDQPWVMLYFPLDFFALRSPAQGYDLRADYFLDLRKVSVQ